MKGVLTGVVGQPVTFVNAPLLAEERGLKVSTLTSPTARDYVSLVRLRAGDVRVAGTLAGPGDRQRLVEVWGFPLDMEPTEHMVFFRYDDRPGVIGEIGTALGEAGVNIASMQVGRHAAGGEAIMALAVDSPVPVGMATGIARRIEATDARTVDLAGDLP